MEEGDGLAANDGAQNDGQQEGYADNNCQQPPLGEDSKGEGADDGQIVQVHESLIDVV